MLELKAAYPRSSKKYVLTYDENNEDIDTVLTQFDLSRPLKADHVDKMIVKEINGRKTTFPLSDLAKLLKLPELTQFGPLDTLFIASSEDLSDKQLFNRLGDYYAIKTNNYILAKPKHQEKKVVNEDGESDLKDVIVPLGEPDLDILRNLAFANSEATKTVIEEEKPSSSVNQYLDNHFSNMLATNAGKVQFIKWALESFDNQTNMYQLTKGDLDNLLELIKEVTSF